jgi:hypothetical protein
MVEAHVKEPNPIDSLRRLRPGSKRRGKEAEGHAGEKASTVHYSMT